MDILTKIDRILLSEINVHLPMNTEEEWVFKNGDGNLMITAQDVDDRNKYYITHFENDDDRQNGVVKALDKLGRYDLSTLIKRDQYGMVEINKK